MARDYLSELRTRVLVFDGSMGANLQQLDLTADDFGGPTYEGCMDALCVTRPDAPAQLHRGFLEVGVDVVETNTFQASRLRLTEWGLGDRTEEINREGARLARAVCDEFEARDGRPRFVAGSIGPSGFLPSSDDPTLSNVTFEQLVQTFEEQARGLIAGGADLLIIETQQDILETKAAIHGARRYFQSGGRVVPIQAQVTLDTNGRMLLGTDVGAALAILENLDADVVGLNCSTGPDYMREPVRYLVQNTLKPISVIPNAGIPINLGGGKARYPLQPEELAAALTEFVEELGVNVVGGCCGTTFEHLRQVVEALRGSAPQVRRVDSLKPRVASAIRAFDLQQVPAPTLVGERVNTQGSRKVKRLLLADQYDDVREVAREQVDGGAHLLDVCVALTERADEARQMVEVVKRLRSSVEAPLVVDSTEPDVVKAALEAYPGLAVVNSTNLEAGREKTDRLVALARQHGAALMAMTIDEQGMAHTAERKAEVARRIHEITCVEHGLPPGRLIFDVLTFPLTTGQEDLRDDARQTIEGIRQVKAELPGVLTSLGLSNVSFGISPAARGVLNSVFLFHCVQAGLDMAIVNPAHLTPYAEIDAEHRALAEDLIYNRREDALPRFLAAFEGVELVQNEAADSDDDLSIDERIHQRILHRKKEGIEDLLDRSLGDRLPAEVRANPTRSQQSAAAVSVLNDVLLPAMKDVGDRFGAGELILPFVLQSAEVMKRSVRYLEQYLEKQEGYTKGTIVAATVYGDVHDIGKSLLITILSNNGYTVHDLGKQVPANTIIEAALEKKADAIGLSALLVSTSKQMPMVVQELDARGIHLPVLIGGAAINRAFGRRSAILPDSRVYEPGVFYCKDVFEGLATMDRLSGEPAGRETLIRQVRAEIEAEQARKDDVAPVARVLPKRGDGPRRDVPVPTAPFWGARRVEADLRDVWRYLDLNTLYRHHFGGHRAKGEEYERIVRELFEPEVERLKEDALRDRWLEARIVSGYFACNAEGNQLVVFDPDRPDTEATRLNFPRQPDGEELCLADYFRPLSSGERDVVVLQAVSAGPRAGRYIQELQEAGDYSRMLYVNGLASSTAEALAEYAQNHARRQLGLGPNQGLRYSWGYPACPDVLEQHKVMPLLRADQEIGLQVSLSGHLDPEHSTAAIVLHHPEAKYFAVRQSAAEVA